MTKTLYIIGNGFDLHHGIKCRYADFKKYCEGQDEEMAKHLEMFHENPEKLWSDFEAEMGNIDADKLLEWARLLDSEWNTGWKGHYRFVDEVSEGVDYLRTLTLSFRDWVLSLKLEDVKPMLKLEKQDSLFLNFNYTKTLEEIYHIRRNQIWYIHGVAEGDFANLVVGHNLSEREVWKKFSSNNELEDEARKEIMELVTGWRKPTEQIIARNENFFQSLDGVKEVMALGHSMASVDMPYFQEVKDNTSPDTTWGISVFDERDYQRKTEAVEELELRKDNVRFFHLEDISLRREGDLF